MATVADLADSASIRIVGHETYDEVGMTVANAGDVNGDGFDDIIVGVPYDDVSATNSGAAYVIFRGSSSLESIDLGNMSPSAGFRIQSGEAFDYLVDTSWQVQDSFL